MPVSKIIKDRVLAVCVNRTYVPGMNAADRYECTRGVWKLNPNRAAMPNLSSRSTTAKSSLSLKSAGGTRPAQRRTIGERLRRKVCMLDTSLSEARCQARMLDSVCPIGCTDLFSITTADKGCPVYSGCFSA